MKRTLSRLLVITLTFVFAFLPSNVTSHAYDSENNKNSSDYYLVITDPETESTWEWALNDTDEGVECIERQVGSDKGENIMLKEIEVDATPYLEQTIKSTSKEWLSASHKSGVKIKTSFQYSVNVKKNTVRMYKTKGSTTNYGNYYASNRHTTWRNPGAGVGGSKYPSSSSWTYTITSTEGTYYYQNPPFSFAECRVNITGMTAYRNISILCSLSGGLQ